MTNGKHPYQYSFRLTSDKYNMDANLDKIALDLYGKIQTRFPDIQMGDETGKVLSKREDIPRARFFEFEYTEDGEPLGTVAITLDGDDGVVLQVSGDLVNDDDHTTHHSAYKFIRSFRQFAKDRLLNFDVQNIGKSNLDKRDYNFQAKRREEPMMEPIMENKLYGSNKISYQDLGEARLVVKHSQPINPTLAAGRTMHIESIYIENAQGERFRYPAKHLNGARALAEHIKAGGNPYDGIGKHITSLSEELAQLRKFKNYVGRQEQLSEAMGSITTKVMERIDSIKKEIHSLQRPTYYQQFAESFKEREEQMIPEEVMSDWIDRLTIRTFNEELKSVFPYLYNIVGEDGVPVLGIGVDDILGEDPEEEFSKARQAKRDAKDSMWAAGKGKGAHAEEEFSKARQSKRDAEDDMWAASKRKRDESLDPEVAFENFINDIVREDKDEIFSPNKDAQRTAIEKLNAIVSKELKGGPEGINATQSLKGLIDDPEFLQSLQDINPELDVRPLIQQFLLDRDPAVAVQVKFGGAETDAKEPEAAPPAEAPPAEAPPPEAGAMPPEAGAMPPGAPPEAAAPPAPPMAEAKDEDDSPPWDVDPKEKKQGKTTPGKHGQGYSQARHLARQGMAKAIAKAKEAGATLETQLDFGHKSMTLKDAIEECGMKPSDVGFDDESGEDGVHQILKSISGFWNPEKRNFTIGGTRAKTKVIKDFKDGEFSNASEDDVRNVLAMIEKMDPSSDTHQQTDILRLAGVRQHDREVAETGPDDMAQFGQLQQLMKQFSDMKSKGGQMPDVSSTVNQMKNMPGAKVTSTSSGTVNGQAASYDDAMSKFKNMKLKFGDDELDLSDPDTAGPQIQKHVGSIFQGLQGKMPNQNVQFPGGQMNPADMMKDIMSKINFGK